MRIFRLNTDGEQHGLTLIHTTEPSVPSRHLHFPVEIIKKIIDYLPRSNLRLVAGVSRVWYATAMPLLYRHLYVRTLPHWLLLLRTMTNENFSYAHHVTSLVLKPSPKLISAQLTSYLNQKVVVNDDILQPGTRGYVRLERVNFDLTGLEGINRPMALDQTEGEHENYVEIDDTKKECEWLTFVTTKQVGSLLIHCPALEYLNLSGCEKLEDEIFMQLVTAKKNNLVASRPVKGLWLNLLRELTSKGLSCLLEFEKSHYESSHLQHLDLGYNILLSKEKINQVVMCWGNTLTHLRLDTIYEVSDQTIQSIATHCPALRLLHITRCWNVSNLSIRLLPLHCKQLKYISLAFLNQVDERGLRSLIENLPELEWLNITGCGINQLFKSFIIRAYKEYRHSHALPPVYIQDGNVNFI